MNTTTQAHTPTPWIDDDTRTFSMKRVIRANGVVIATLPIVKAGMTADELEANARLLVAAPELFAALQALFEHCVMTHKHWGEGDNMKQADAAQAAAHLAMSKVRGNQ